jgi:hypothetical protein
MANKSDGGRLRPVVDNVVWRHKPPVTAASPAQLFYEPSAFATAFRQEESRASSGWRESRTLVKTVKTRYTLPDAAYPTEELITLSLW